MESSKRLSIMDDVSAAAMPLRRLTRTPTGQRLSLRRLSITSSSSAMSSTPSVSTLDDEQTPLSCASRNASSSSSDDCALSKFIVWAAIKRNACEKMTVEERRECPMLHCRKRLPNHELMLRHLSLCEHLSDGEYWCYDCEQPEKINDAKCRRCLGHPSKRRKLMSMAKKVFGSLGNRPKGNPLSPVASHLHVGEEPPSYDSVMVPAAFTELPTNEIHEIDSVEIALPTIPECEPESSSDLHLMLQPPYALNHGSGTRTDPPPPDLEIEYFNWDPSPSPSVMAPPPLPSQHQQSLQQQQQQQQQPNFARSFVSRSSDRPSLQLHTHGLDQYRAQAKRRSKTLAPSSSVRSTSSTDSTDSTNSTNSTASNESYEISPLSGWSGGWAKGPGCGSALTSPCDDFVSPEDALSSVNTFTGSVKPVEFTISELGSIVANSHLPQIPAEIPSSIDILSSELALQDTMMSLEPPEFSFDASVPLHLPVDSNPLSAPHTSLPQPIASTPDTVVRASLVTARSFVKSAQATFRVHITESMMKLSELSNNPRAHEFGSMTPSAIARAGLETLTAVLEGRQDISPIHLICFIHVIFSMSLMVHEQDIESRCASLFKQAMLYSHWLSIQDRPWYIEVVYSLWKPDNVSDSDIIDLLKDAPASPTSDQAREKGKGLERTLQGLQCDSLVVIAQYFLDELEFLALHEVSHPEVQASDLNIHHLKDGLGMDQNSPFSIAARFLIQGGFSGFSTRYPQVPAFVSSLQAIIDQLSSGRITTVRRLELEMMQAGKNHLPSEIFFDDYAGQVRCQLDFLYAVHGSSINSRLTYHSYGIKLLSDLMEGCSHVQPKTQDICAQATPTPKTTNEFISPVTHDLDFDLEDMFCFGQEDEPATSIGPSADADDWQPRRPSDVPSLVVTDCGDCDSSTTLTPAPAPAPLFPPPPITPIDPATTRLTTPVPNKMETPTPATSTKVESDSCCEICGYRPKGDPRWFGGSMAKHKKLQHSTETKIYRCPYPGCTSQYSKRPDNLRQHQIDKGHFVDGQGSTGRRSRKREWVADG